MYVLALQMPHSRPFISVCPEFQVIDAEREPAAVLAGPSGFAHARGDTFGDLDFTFGTARNGSLRESIATSDAAGWSEKCMQGQTHCCTHVAIRQCLVSVMVTILLLCTHRPSLDDVIQVPAHDLACASACVRACKGYRAWVCAPFYTHR